MGLSTSYTILIATVMIVWKNKDEDANLVQHVHALENIRFYCSIQRMRTYQYTLRIHYYSSSYVYTILLLLRSYVV